MTAFAIFALTTAGPVQIQRISRERAPLSMMVLGRGSERLAVSDRYDDFVYPGGGPVEKFLGPFPEGGFRLEVSAPIDSGDSWQLAAFMAHAVVAAGSHSLCRDVEEAEAILCLTGTVDFDGLIGGVGHIAEKMQAARDDLTRWRQGDVAPVFIVPSGDDHDRLLANDPGSGLAIQGAETVSELCAVLDIPLAPVSSPIEVEKPRPSPEKTARGGKWAWPVVAVVVAALVVPAGQTGGLVGLIGRWAAEGIREGEMLLLCAVRAQPKILLHVRVARPGFQAIGVG